MSSTHQIGRTQLRALLLLLVLLPLLPAGVMFRYMLESLIETREQVERDLEEILFRQLPGIQDRVAERFPEPAQAEPEEVLRRLREELRTDAAYRVLDAEGEVLAFSGMPGRDYFWQRIPLKFNGWQFQWARERPGFFSEEFRESTFQMLAVGAGTTLIVLVIAIVAGREVTRRLDLAELRSTRLSQLAHEIRTPVAGIQATLETLQGGRLPDDPQARADYLGMLARESRRLQDIAELFLLHNRIERGHPLPLEQQEIDPCAICRQIAEEIRPEITQAGGTLHLDLETDEPGTVLGDPQAFETILRNLLGNARKYTEHAPEIRLACRRAGDSAEIRVRDNGIGIAPRDQRRIFDSYYRVDTRLSQQAGGVGLGLTIVRGLVESMNGQVQVESQLGEGSVFTLRFPNNPNPNRNLNLNPSDPER